MIVGFDAEQDDQPGLGLGDVEGAAHVAHECEIFGHVVIGRQDGHGHVAGEVAHPQQRIEDAGGRAAVRRLHHQPLRMQLPGEPAPVRLVLVGDDDDLPVGPHDQVGAAPGAVEQRLAVEDGAELLGTIVTGDPLRQRAEPRAIATSENDRPGGHRSRGHGARIVEQEGCRDVPRTILQWAPVCAPVAAELGKKLPRLERNIVRPPRETP